MKRTDSLYGWNTSLGLCAHHAVLEMSAGEWLSTERLQPS